MRTLMLRTDTVDGFLSGYSEIKSAISRTGEITSIATDDQNPLSAFIIAMVWLHDKEDAVTKALQSLIKGTEGFYGHLLRDVFHPLFKSLSEKATSVHIPALNTSIDMAPLYFGPGKTQVNSETFASSIMSHNMKMVDNRSREKIFVSNKFTNGKFPVSCNISAIVRTDFGANVSIAIAILLPLLHINDIPAVELFSDKKNQDALSKFNPEIVSVFTDMNDEWETIKRDGIIPEAYDPCFSNTLMVPGENGYTAITPVPSVAMGIEINNRIWQIRRQNPINREQAQAEGSQTYIRRDPLVEYHQYVFSNMINISSMSMFVKGRSPLLAGKLPRSMVAGYKKGIMSKIRGGRFKISDFIQEGIWTSLIDGVIEADAGIPYHVLVRRVSLVVINLRESLSDIVSTDQINQLSENSQVLIDYAEKGDGATREVKDAIVQMIALQVQQDIEKTRDIIMSRVSFDTLSRILKQIVKG